MGAQADEVITKTVKRVVDISGKAASEDPLAGMNLPKMDDTSVRMPLNHDGDDTKLQD